MVNSLKQNKMWCDKKDVHVNDVSTQTIAKFGVRAVTREEARVKGLKETHLKNSKITVLTS
jgi:hypothetical protein